MNDPPCYYSTFYFFIPDPSPCIDKFFHIWYYLDMIIKIYWEEA